MLYIFMSIISVKYCCMIKKKWLCISNVQTEIQTEIYVNIIIISSNIIVQYNYN